MKPLDQVGQPQRIENNPPVRRKKERSLLQEHFLARVERLVRQREEQLESDPSDKQSLRLLSRALYSTYLDCVSVGVGDKANAFLENAQSSER